MPNLSDYRKRDENTAEWVYYCPDCKDEEDSSSPLKLGSEYRFKQHMMKVHGGWSEDNSGSEPESAPPVVQTTQPPPVQKAKKLSTKSRELNDKLNRCFSLCLKHFMKGLDASEQQELTTLRAEVTEGLMGIQIDFDDKLVSVSGRWAAIIAVLGIWILPQLPTFTEMKERAKEQSDAAAAHD